MATSTTTDLSEAVHRVGKALMLGTRFRRDDVSAMYGALAFPKSPAVPLDVDRLTQIIRKVNGTPPTGVPGPNAVELAEAILAELGKEG